MILFLMKNSFYRLKIKGKKNNKVIIDSIKKLIIYIIRLK